MEVSLNTYPVPGEEDTGMEVSLNMYPVPGEEASCLLWSCGLAHLGCDLGGVRLSQTCGLPLVTHQAGHVKVVAIPRYGVAGCQGHRYSSVLVVHSTSPITSVSDLKDAKVAVNSIDSLSGHLLLGLTLGRSIYSSTVPTYTGSHLASLRMVTSGLVDAASIDCVTYALAQKHNPQLTANTWIVATSPSFPALPYVVNKDVTDENLREVQEVLKKALVDPTLAEVRHKLCIEGFEFCQDRINESVYEEEIKNEFSTLDISNDNEDQNDCYNSDAIILDKMEEDKNFLKEAFDFAVEVLKQSGGTQTELESLYPDGRRIRVITTGGENCVRETQRSQADIVGFFGTQLRLHETCFENLKMISRVWKADDLIVNNFDPLVVEAYITSETEPGGDWFNLVILREGAKVEDFTGNNKVHRKVVEEVGPSYYSRVRIHRGVLSLQGGPVTFSRTLSCHYRRGTLAKREVKIWK